MTEKQYKLEQWSSLSLYYSFPEGNLHHSIGKVIARVENDLNSLYNENEKLKKILSISENDNVNDIVDVLNLQQNEIWRVKRENELLKQFKEDVFAKIDMHLRMLPTARDNEFNEEDGDPSLYSGAIYMLETLKKELQE